MKITLGYGIIEEWLFLKAGRYPDAVESFEIALDLEPDNAKAWINMGVSLGAMGRFT